MTIQRVLIVDDSLSSRLVLRRMLERQNVGAEMVASAEEAMTFLTDNKPDAIFMDHDMPGMNGLQALDEIKKNTLTQAIPVAMFTTKEETDYIKIALQHGAIGVLPKPFNEGALSSILETLHASARASRLQKPEAANDDHPEEAANELPGESAETAGSKYFDPQTVEKMIRAIADEIAQDVIHKKVTSLLDERLLAFKQEMKQEINQEITRTLGTLKTQPEPGSVLSEEQVKTLAISALTPSLEQNTQQLSSLVSRQVSQVAEETLAQTKKLIDTAQHEQAEAVAKQIKNLEGKISDLLIIKKSKPYRANENVINVRPEDWEIESPGVTYPKQTPHQETKIKRLYAFAGLTTIIIGIVITGLMLLSSLLQLYQDIEP